MTRDDRRKNKKEVVYVKHKTAKANVKTKTRLLSLLLAVLMTLFCFPVTALGTDGIEGPISETLEETADAGLSAFERGTLILYVSVCVNIFYGVGVKIYRLSAVSVLEDYRVQVFFLFSESENVVFLCYCLCAYHLGHVGGVQSHALERIG